MKERGREGERGGGGGGGWWRGDRQIETVGQTNRQTETKRWKGESEELETVTGDKEETVST